MVLQNDGIISGPKNVIYFVNCIPYKRAKQHDDVTLALPRWGVSHTCKLPPLFSRSNKDGYGFIKLQNILAKKKTFVEFPVNFFSY